MFTNKRKFAPHGNENIPINYFIKTIILTDINCLALHADRFFKEYDFACSIVIDPMFGVDFDSYQLLLINLLLCDYLITAVYLICILCFYNKS